MTECKTCGAAVDPPYEDVLVHPNTPYFVDGGVSFRVDTPKSAVWLK